MKFVTGAVFGQDNQLEAKRLEKAFRGRVNMHFQLQFNWIVTCYQTDNIPQVNMSIFDCI